MKKVAFYVQIIALILIVISVTVVAVTYLPIGTTEYKKTGDVIEEWTLTNSYDVEKLKEEKDEKIKEKIDIIYSFDGCVQTYKDRCLIEDELNNENNYAYCIYDAKPFCENEIDIATIVLEREITELDDKKKKLEKVK